MKKIEEFKNWLEKIANSEIDQFSEKDELVISKATVIALSLIIISFFNSMIKKALVAESVISVIPYCLASFAMIIFTGAYVFIFQFYIFKIRFGYYPFFESYPKKSEKI